MRRLICAALFVASSIGILAIPATADPQPVDKITLSFDYSDNNAHASASNGTFNVIVNILPEDSVGLIRMVAVSLDTNDNNLVCRFQWINKSQVECAFNFTDNGIWAIHAQYEGAPQTDVVATAVTKLRVIN